MNPALVQAELRRLSRLNMDGWNESDVREDFIAKLLNLLGYRKGSDYDINREGTHLLPKPFLYIGRKRIDIDYALMIRLQPFWIIEAKAAEPLEIEEKAIFQAHYYAMHPEVTARFFAVCNGRETLLYDTRNLTDEFQPILRIRLEDIEHRFADLNAILGIGQIRAVLRERLFCDMKVVLGAEVRQEALNDFGSRVQDLLRELRPIVRENWRRAYREKANEIDTGVTDLFTVAESPEQLIRVGFEFPVTFHEFELVCSVFDDRLRGLDEDDKARLFGYICRVLRGRPTMLLQKNLIHLLLRYATRYEELVKRIGGESMLNEVRRSLKMVLSDYSEAPLAGELARLEDNLHRVIYKLTFLPKNKDFFRQVAAKKSALIQEEDLACRPPCSAGERVHFVATTVEETFRKTSHLDLGTLRQLNQDLEAIEDAVDPAFMEQFAQRQKDEKDIMFFGSYGRNFDIRSSALCELVSANIDVAAPFLDDLEDDLIAKLRQCSDSFNVNYADQLLTKYWARKGSVEVDDPVHEFLQSHQISACEACQKLHIHPHFTTGSLSIRAWGDIGGGCHVEIFGELDLDAKKLLFTRACNLE